MENNNILKSSMVEKKLTVVEITMYCEFLKESIDCDLN